MRNASVCTAQDLNSYSRETNDSCSSVVAPELHRCRFESDPRRSNMAEDEVRVLADAKKMDMADRVAHSNWKARNAAYEDIKSSCSRVYEDSDPCLAEYGATTPFRTHKWSVSPVLSCRGPLRQGRRRFKRCGAG